ncbi:MAG: oligosaccharide flippase family protein [Myxococcota bacterium]
MAAAVIRSKASAVFLGPEGVGMAAELQQVVTLTLVPLSALSGPALMQALADERAKGREPAAVAAALTWLMALGLFLGIVAVLGGFLLLPDSWSDGLRPLLALACVGATATAAANVGIATLTFDGALNTTARLQLLTSIATAILVALSTAAFGLAGQFFALAIAAALSVPFVFRAARSSQSWPARILKPDFDTGYLRRALVLGAASLIGSGALQAALLSIRTRLDGVGGPHANGQFQAAWAVGSLYLGMVLAGIGNFVFPRYAAAQNREQLQREMNSAAHFVMKLAPPIVLLAIAFADLAIRLMYSTRFDEAAEILRWQFAGDIAKCLSWVYAGPLLYRGRVRAFLVTELTASAILSASTWLLADQLGIRAAGVGYFLSYMVYLPISAMVVWRSLEVKAQPRELLLVWLGTGIAIGLLFVPGNWLPRILAASASLAWLLLSGGRDDLRVLAEQLRRKLSRQARQLDE